MKEDKIPNTLQAQAFKRAKNPTSLNAGTPHDWEDLYQNTKQMNNMKKLSGIWSLVKMMVLRA